jgi:type IV pilus assembly protein PilC
MKSRHYLWEGVTKTGNTITGEQVAINRVTVKALLRRQGITPINIRIKSPFYFLKQPKKIKPLEIAVFTRQLSTLLGAGIPLVQALELVTKSQTNPSLTILINTLKSDVEAGSTLTAALNKHPMQFNSLYCHLVAAGEQSGTLEKLLENIATYKEKTESIKGKIKKALYYPAAVITVAMIVTMILLLLVVPQFESLFNGFGANLPAFTRLVIAVSSTLQHYGWLLIAMLIAIITGIRIGLQKSVALAQYKDKALLKLPILGKVFEKAVTARFARTLATTYAAGLPLVDALRTVAGAAGNILFQKATLQIREDIIAGQNLTLALQATKIFPNLVIQMIQIGEESGSLDKMLNKVSEFYEEQVDNAVDSFSSLLEPIIMVVLGVVIGGLVIAMYLPIFKLGNII